MCLKRRLIKLLYLCKQAVVLKGVVGLFGLVAHPQVYKLRAQAHHLGNAADQIVSHLVTKAHALAHMLVERNRALLAPRALALFELHLVVLLRIGTRRLTAHLHRGVGRLLSIGDLASNGALIIARLQQAHNLIACHAHVGIVVDRVGIDLGPAMIGILGAVAARDRQVHAYDARVVVNLVQLVLVAKMLGLARRIGLFNLALLLGLFCRGFVLRRAARKQQCAGSRLNQAATRYHPIGHQDLPNDCDTREPPCAQTRHAARPLDATPHSAVRHGRASSPAP